MTCYGQRPVRAETKPSSSAGSGSGGSLGLPAEGIPQQLLSFVVEVKTGGTAASRYPLFVAPCDLIVEEPHISASCLVDTPTVGLVVTDTTGDEVTTDATKVIYSALLSLSSGADPTAAPAPFSDALWMDATGATAQSNLKTPRNKVKRGQAVCLVVTPGSSDCTGSVINVTLRVTTRVLDLTAVGQRAAFSGRTGSPTFNANENNAAKVCSQDIPVGISACAQDTSTYGGIPVLTAPYDLVIEEIFCASTSATSTWAPTAASLVFYKGKANTYTGVSFTYAATTGDVNLNSSAVVSDTVATLTTAGYARASTKFLDARGVATGTSNKAPSRNILRKGQTLYMDVPSGTIAALGNVYLTIRVSSHPGVSEGGTYPVRVENAPAKASIIVPINCVGAARPTPGFVSDREYVIERMWVMGHPGQGSTTANLGMSSSTSAGKISFTTFDPATDTPAKLALLGTSASYGIDCETSALGTGAVGGPESVPVNNVVPAGYQIQLRTAATPTAGMPFGVTLVLSTGARDRYSGTDQTNVAYGS